MHAYIHTYIHNTYTHTYIHTYTHMHTYIHKHIHTYTHTYIHTYIHTHTHTYIHTYVQYENNRQKYIRVQRLINIRMAKAYRTTSSEALCILTGMTPIIIKLVEVVKRYNIMEKMASRSFELDPDVDLKYWPHPADVVTVKEVACNEEASVQAYTD